jgi:uncharacterized oxidoreductase
MELKNNTILITGGTSGIGLEMAQQLSKLGNTVIVTGRNKTKIDQLKENEPQLYAYTVEVTDLASIQALYERLEEEFPQLNVLINNAGLMSNIYFKTAKPEGIADEVTTNLSGPILMTQVFLPLLLRQKNACIVNVTSGIAYYAFEKAPIYSASKLGLHSYTQSLRKQLKKTSVKVFELAPPRTTKPMFKGSEADNATVDHVPKMPIATVVEKLIDAMKKDQYEIKPGMSKLLKILGKIQL